MRKALASPTACRRGVRMKRREFITLCGVAVAWPLAARAQQPARIRRVGVLMNLSENDLEAQRLVMAFRDGLAQLGWVDGRNLRIDYRWASGDVSRIRVFAKELTELSPDIIVGYATPSVVALQQATRSIPIVFLSGTCCCRLRIPPNRLTSSAREQEPARTLPKSFWAQP